MANRETHFRLKAAEWQQEYQTAAVCRFKNFLDEFDIFITDLSFVYAGMGAAENFQVVCHLQAPTIYDVAVRLAKAGWRYTDATENRAAPYLIGPSGEQVRITRGSDCAKMVFTPAEAEGWAQHVKQEMDGVACEAVKRALPAVVAMDLAC